MMEWVIIGKAWIIALLVLSIWYSFQEGEIFGFVTKWGDDHVPKKLRAPLYDCNVCMSFWYGSGIYYLLYQNSWVEWIVVVICSMGFNAALNKLSPDK